MGMSISWVCVRGKTIEQVLVLLSGERQRLTWDNIYASPMRIVDMQNGWLVLECYPELFFVDRPAFLEALSQDGEIIVCHIEEHVMCSTAFAMKNGSKIWTISHQSENAFDHLDSEGTMPDCFDEIRTAAVEKMKTRHRSLFGVPVDVCKEITGYHQNLHPLKTVHVPIPFL
ncbi:MAG: hypothetical protein WC028_23335 [Candidatus Obscuribacterales bacterium]